MEDLNQIVRVSVPMSIASDLGAFKKTLGSILDHIGCPACCSGNDILFETQRRFTFARDLKTPQAAFAERKLAANDLASPSRMTTAALSPKLANGIEEVFAAIDKIAGLSAHPNCTSGDDLFLRMERNILVDLSGRIQEQALVIG